MKLPPDGVGVEVLPGEVGDELPPQAACAIAAATTRAAKTGMGESLQSFA